MPAPELNPQTPGQASTEATTNATPQETAGEGENTDANGVDVPMLQELAKGTVDEIVELLPTLTEAELVHLREIEQAGSARVTALRAIDAELARNTESTGDEAEQAAAIEASAAASPQPGADGVVRKDSQPVPVLTDAGWVVPEPVQPFPKP